MTISVHQLETLRLYPPIMALPKYTDQRPQTLRVGKKVIVVGPGTMVVPSLLAMHTHPKYWSPDPLIWRPSRWISSKVANPNSSPSETTPPTSLENEELFTPAKGTYIPWSEGPQHCPGKQFAQVEFVAVLARLFRTHRVQPFSRKGESPATVRRRLLGVCEDSEQRLLLQMRNPDRVRLIWSGR